MEKEINPWKTISQQTAYENAWIKVEHHEVLNPAGNPGIYGKVHLKTPLFPLFQSILRDLPI